MEWIWIWSIICSLQETLAPQRAAHRVREAGPRQGPARCHQKKEKKKKKEKKNTNTNTNTNTSSKRRRVSDIQQQTIQTNLLSASRVLKSG